MLVRFVEENGKLLAVIDPFAIPASQFNDYTGNLRQSKSALVADFPQAFLLKMSMASLFRLLPLCRVLEIRRKVGWAKPTPATRRASAPV